MTLWFDLIGFMCKIVLHCLCIEINLLQGVFFVGGFLKYNVNRLLNTLQIESYLLNIFQQSFPNKVSQRNQILHA